MCTHWICFCSQIYTQIDWSHRYCDHWCLWARIAEQFFTRIGRFKSTRTWKAVISVYRMLGSMRECQEWLVQTKQRLTFILITTSTMQYSSTTHSNVLSSKLCCKSHVNCRTWLLGLCWYNLAMSWLLTNLISCRWPLAKHSASKIQAGATDGWAMWDLTPTEFQCLCPLRFLALTAITVGAEWSWHTSARAINRLWWHAIVTDQHRKHPAVAFTCRPGYTPCSSTAQLGWAFTAPPKMLNL